MIIYRICLTASIVPAINLLLIQIVQCIFYYLINYPTGVCQGTFVLGKSVHRMNDHRPFDKPLYIILILHIGPHRRYIDKYKYLLNSIQCVYGQFSEHTNVLYSSIIVRLPTCMY